MTTRGRWLYAVWAFAILVVGVVQLGLGNGVLWLVFAIAMICSTWLMQRAGRQGEKDR